MPSSIDRTCFLINRTLWIKFFLNSVLTNSKHFFKTFSNFPLSLRLGKAPLKIFCHFSTKFLQGFSLTRPVRPLYPFFCFYFHDFMHKLMHFKGFSELFKFGIFDQSILFFRNWSMGFASILIYSWYMLVNLINLGFCEQLKILGFVLNLIWGFCSIRLKLMKLSCWIDVIDHYKLFSNLCDDQLVNFFKKTCKWFYIFWGFS